MGAAVADESITELLELLDVNCKALYSGWREKVDYKVPVTYHSDDCTRPPRCECPVVEEKRTREVQRPGLLDQLREFQQNKDVDRNPKAERAAPRVKKPKLHPELNGFLTLDEITCEAYMMLDRIFEEVGRDRTWLSQSVKGIMMGLVYQVSQFAGQRPDLARQVLNATTRWVYAARRTLNVTVSDAMLEGVVCGNCGGGLTVAWDNSSEVRCIGKPDEPPCGHTYPKEEWVSLYEQQRSK
jgi:hypothetical protein